MRYLWFRLTEDFSLRTTILAFLLASLSCSWWWLRSAAEFGDGRDYGFPQSWECSAGNRAQGAPNCVKSPSRPDSQPS